MRDKKTGVLLLNFGAPQRLDEVEDFVMHVCQGKKPPDYVLEIIKKRYAFMGGGSPLCATARAQAEGLEGILKKSGQGDCSVYTGMLHSKPFIETAVQQMMKEGINRIFALSMAPFYSQVSTGAYYKEVEKAVKAGFSHVDVVYGPEWHTLPSFIDAWKEKISLAMGDFSCPEQVNLIFTTHSLPLAPRQDAEHYQRQYQTAVEEIIKGLPYDKVYAAYQSKSRGTESWLGPQLEEVLEDLASRGESGVLVVPVGFLVDHLETLYDLDVEMKKKAEILKIDFRRTSTLNDDSHFIKVLAEVVLALK